MNTDGTLTLAELRDAIDAAVEQIGLRTAEPTPVVVDAIVEAVRHRGNSEFDPNKVRYFARPDSWGHTRVTTQVLAHPSEVPPSAVVDPQTRWGLLGASLPHDVRYPSDPGTYRSKQDLDRACAGFLDPVQSVAEYLYPKMRRLRPHLGPISVHDLLKVRPVDPYRGRVSKMLDASRAGRWSGCGYITASALLRDELGTVWLDTYAGSGAQDRRRRVSIMLTTRNRDIPSLVAGACQSLLPEPSPIPHHDGLVIVDRLFTTRDNRSSAQENR